MHSIEYYVEYVKTSILNLFTPGSFLLQSLSKPKKSG